MSSPTPDDQQSMEDTPINKPGESDVMYSLFLSNLDSSLDDSSLMELIRSQSFASNNPDVIHSAHIITDRETKQSKGFGFVHFTDKTAYESALSECGSLEVKGKTMKAFPAEDKTRVYVRNLPKDWSEDKIKEEITAAVGEVKEFNVRGEYAFLTFINFVQAERGVKKLNTVTLNGSTLHAEPAKSNKNREVGGRNGSASEEASTCLHVRHITPTLTKEMLQNHFSDYGSIREVRIPQDKVTNKNSGFAFVDFDDSKSAQRALDKLNRSSLDGAEIEISFSRSKTASHASAGRDARGGGRDDARGGRGGRDNYYDSRGSASIPPMMGYPPYGYPGMPPMNGRGAAAAFPPHPYGAYMPYNPYAASAGGNGRGRESATAFPAYGMNPAMAGGYPYMDPRYMAAYGMMGAGGAAGVPSATPSSSSGSSSKKDSSSSRRRSRSREKRSESRSRSRSRSRDRKRR